MKRFLLTREEQMLVAFVSLALIVGAIVKNYRAHHPLATHPGDGRTEAMIAPRKDSPSPSPPARTRPRRKRTSPELASPSPKEDADD